MPADPLSIGFDVPFDEAIAAALARGVVLPSVYYQQLRGLARQLAFSISGITAIEQLQAVLDSLAVAMQTGQSFTEWRDEAAVMDLNLPKHRLDNIWRTNLQGNYMRGKWEQFVENAESRQYLQYDAINDTRVRPSHLAMDGVIRRWDDPFWKTHSPPNGYRCRCSLFSLTEAQARARTGVDKKGRGTGLNKEPVNLDGSLAVPDKGWDYHPYEDQVGVLRKVLNEVKAAAGQVLGAAILDLISELDSLGDEPV